jgi:hypothetical protein
LWKFLVSENNLDADVEKYVNLFIAKQSELSNTSEFSIVSGKDIAYWYDFRRYHGYGGSLNSSCMRNAN